MNIEYSFEILKYKKYTLFTFKEYYFLVDIYYIYIKKDKEDIFYIERNDLWSIIKEYFPNCILNKFKNDCILKNEIFNIFSKKSKLYLKNFISLVSLFQKSTLSTLTIVDFMYKIFSNNIFNELDKNTILFKIDEQNFTLEHFIDNLKNNIDDLTKIEHLIEYFFKLN